MAGVVPDAPGLLGLPVEMGMEILSFALLNSSNDILNLAMSCKAIYNILNHHKTSILLAFLSQMDPSELAIATAHYHATIAPWRCTKDLDVPVPQDQNDYLCKITDFCEQFLSKQGTELRIPFQDFTLPMVAHIQDIHFTIRRIATKLVPRIIFAAQRWLAPSSVEMAKISKSLYIIDLVRLLFLKSPVTLEQHMGSDFSQHDHAFTKFWSYFSPWESEQVEIMTFEIMNRLPFLTVTRFDFVRIIMWKGMKGIDALFHEGASEDDERLCRHISSDHRFKAIRDMASQALTFWFEGPGTHTVNIDPATVKRYDADIDDGSARVWLCIYNCLDITGQIRRGNYPWGCEIVEGFPIFFDIDRLLAITQGRLPVLDDLLEWTGDSLVSIGPI
ncbi:hypothetical protein F4782DRAFT_528215 [Xylaria castorea]|nr:hypothetical protein F4782DRAFT_528215 [Xylaria castorea]